MAINRLMQMAAAGLGGEPEGAWDLSYAYYDDPFAWDISTANVLQNFSVSGQESVPMGLFFKPDGTKMYICGHAGVDVNEYDLSTAWDISSASFVQNFSVSSQEATPDDLFFKPDGTKMYVIGSSSDAVNEYDLSSAWDISTASYLQNFSVGSQDTSPESVFFKPDGTKMYIAGNTGDDINEYDLSTAWDVSSASFLQNFSVAAQEATVYGLFFREDGLKMYITGISGDEVNEYDLSSAWDISSASFVQNLSVASQEGNPASLFFKPDGSFLYIIGYLQDQIHQYTLGGFDVSAQETGPKDISFKPDGTKMYVIGSTGDDVNEYDLTTEWDTSTASFLQNFSVATQETTPQGIFFKPDGTKMYVTGSAGDDVNEYDLSVAWDVSSASYNQNFSVSSQTIRPTAVFFRPDGSKMYVLAETEREVNEYDLSTAWDISSASFLQSLDIQPQGSFPCGLFFRDDGEKMYTTSRTDDEINEFDLSSAWDVSSASFLQNFSVSSQGTEPQGVFFKPDGTQMFTVDSGSDAVFTYSLGVQE